MMCPDLPKVTNPDFRHYYKYNFMTLLSETPTIEFRQHEGTINAEEIIRWVKFVSGLVDLAHNIDIQNLARLVHLTDTKPVSFTELCAAMVIFGSMNPDDQHVLHYTRKINARGENLHTRTYMKYMEETPHVCWRDVSESRKDPDAREFQ